MIRPYLPRYMQRVQPVNTANGMQNGLRRANAKRQSHSDTLIQDRNGTTARLAYCTLLSCTTQFSDRPEITILPSYWEAQVPTFTFCSRPLQPVALLDAQSPEQPAYLTNYTVQRLWTGKCRHAGPQEQAPGCPKPMLAVSRYAVPVHP